MTPVAPRSIRRLVLLLAVVVTAVLAAGAGSASADFGFAPGSLSADAFNAAGQYETQAGAHPFSASTTFQFTTKDDGNGLEVPDHWVKDVQVDLPQGFVGDPQAAPTCAWSALASGFGGSACPTDSQVGTVDLDWFPVNPPRTTWTLPLFNMEPSNGHVAEFGFKTSLTQSALVASVRPGDNGIRIRTNNISQGASVFGVKVTLWGVPGDPAHDPQRGQQCSGMGSCFGGNTPYRAKVHPFLTNPTECAGPLTTTFNARSWEDPSTWVTATATTAVAVTGCDRLSFEPTIAARPDVRTPASPAGLAVDLSVPQNSGPTELASATLRNATVTLPEGVVVNPGSADGLGACSDAQIELQSDAAPSCPESSRIGTVTLTTPVLPRPVLGSVYLGRQTPSRLLRLFLVLDDQGLLVKLPGRVDADATTGRLTATFVDNPQLPFGNLHLELKGGARAPLTTPAACGTFTTRAELTPWSSPTAVVAQDAMAVDQGCAAVGGFAPGFSAGGDDASAGGHSTFHVRVTRAGTDNAAAGVAVTLPPGLLADVADVPRCPEPQASSGACNPASQIGTATVGAGAGNSPVYLPQAGKAPTAVYLAGPYQGAPFSLSIVVPAQAGPFDLGTVVVRARLDIDPITAQATVTSDPLPTIMKGIALNVRDIRVDVDRPGFVRNPTDCDAQDVTGAITAAAGLLGAPSVGADGVGIPKAVGPVVAVRDRFQATGCASLDLEPSLALSLRGKGQTRDGGHPAVSALVSQPAGQANLKKVRVALPLSLALDPDNAASDALCSFAEGSKPLPVCPASSVVGRATAVTPILDQPLTGPVYFVKNERKDPKSGRSIRTTPKLVIPLTGENGVKLTLTGASTVVDDQLVTTFDNIPDAPVSSFRLDIAGGKKGILVVSGADICKSTQLADQRVDGQNNKTADADVAIQTPSCPLKVLSKTVGKTSVAVKVSGLGAGKVTVTGKGIKKTTRTIATSTVATVTAKRIAHAKPGKIKVSFLPKGAKKAKTV